MSEDRPGGRAERIQLNVLGQTLTVRSAAGAEYLRGLARFLEERVAALRASGVRDTLTSVTLAALEITDELFRARDQKHREETEVEDRLGALLELLERAAPRSGSRPEEGA